uniref:Aldehyde dehydrogenase n=1 Tax=Globisporangium ultimum (strain ATCC 200006 / CBS 805.95 / DAOM BR144) TaxID=431595 RepID=K3WWD1_GLOUD
MCSSKIPSKNTGAARVPDASSQDITAAVSDLRASFNSGATKDTQMRKRLLGQLQQLMREGEPALKEALWKDLHKHPTESYAVEFSGLYGEVQDHLDCLDAWTAPERVTTNLANLPGLSYIHREPLGVVCVIGTWNYPVNLMFTPLIAAISAGNCVLLRLPGEDTTMHTNNVLISLLDKYMDNRYVRYVYGGVEETKAMLRERFDLIFATGGCFLGKVVAKAAAEHLTPTILELGGKSPVIVDASANLALAAKRIAWGAFTNSGLDVHYVLVDAKVSDQFVEALQDTIYAFYGHDIKGSSDYGRIINDRSFHRLADLLDADRKCITFLAGSCELDTNTCFIAPTLLNFKTDYDAFVNSAVMQQELFGPLLPIYYYDSGLSMPVEFITKRAKPLALYVFTADSETKQRVIKDTTAGSMVVNDTMMQLTNPHVPFGGVGNSGMGAYHGKFGLEAFSHRKIVIYKYSVLDLAQRCAPYSPSSERVLRVVQYPISRAFMRSLQVAGYACLLTIISFGIRVVAK